MIQGLNGMSQYLDAAVKAFHETDAQLAAFAQVVTARQDPAGRVLSQLRY